MTCIIKKQKKGLRPASDVASAISKGGPKAGLPTQGGPRMIGLWHARADFPPPGRHRRDAATDLVVG